MSPRRRRGIAFAAVFAAAAVGCSKDWPAFRHNPLRSAAQLNTSPLSDPSQVPALAVHWTYTVSGGTPFRASPIVFKGKVFVGNSNGRLYALDATTGALLWQYPAAAQPALTSSFTCNPSSEGIASSAVIATIAGKDAVIFAAPDRSIGTGLGEGRLFAVDMTGAEIWKSPVIARLTGTSGGSTTELHEQMGYSSPLVWGDRIYVGIGNHCDNPIQKGRVVSVNLTTGAIDPGFHYCSTGTCGDSARGGGVWSPPAAWSNMVYVTTGNTRAGAPTEPSPNRGLSLLGLDQTTGAVAWKYQPVPWALDGDPDWSAAPTVVLATCGTIVASTQKDGWTHAVDGTSGAHRWTFPPHAVPFMVGDGTTHGDTRYMRGGAAWGDVYIAMNGGLNLTASGVSGGFGRLHAFNVCAGELDRLRWIVDVPHSGTGNYRLGNPTVTRGVVYVGTTEGHLVAIADPSISPAAGWRCSNPDVATASCVGAGYTLIPQPAILADVALVGRIVYSEPALANGKVYVATEAGNVYMLSP